MSYNATVEPGSKNSEPERVQIEPDILAHKHRIILELWLIGGFKTHLTPARLNKWLTWSRGSIEPIAWAMMEVQGQQYPAMFVDDILKRAFDILTQHEPIVRHEPETKARMSKDQAQAFILSHPDLSTRALSEATGIPH